MGYYINSLTETKEAFLEREAELLDSPPNWNEIPFGFLPVVWVENDSFTAAGIASCEKELKLFSDPSDPRPRKYYLIDMDKLWDVSELPRDGFINRVAKSTKA